LLIIFSSYIPSLGKRFWKLDTRGALVKVIDRKGKAY